MSDKNDQAWAERVASLGLDPVRDAGRNTLIQTKSLQQFAQWFKFPANPKAERIRASAEQIEGASMPLLRRFITDHVTNARVLDDSAASAVENRMYKFTAIATVAPDIEITAANPLIIISNSTITVYNNVTIRDGGYIRITVPCSFECQALTKIQGGSGATEFDVYAVGKDGDGGKNGESPLKPAKAKDGKNAKCDSCGGIVAQDPTNGKDGEDGDDGGNATNGGNAGDSAVVSFAIRSALTGTLTFLARGGNGGPAGAGGRGAQGGDGGDGGDGKQCGGDFEGGANGGVGGNGGNGGNGGSGGNGGNGSPLMIIVPDSAKSQVLVMLRESNGGAGGERGARGLGGKGGTGGKDGGENGMNGKPGATDGLTGEDGLPGDRGTATINGQPA